MNSNKALWQAVAAVCIPNLLFLGTEVVVLNNPIASDAWPIYLRFFVLLLPQICPIYRHQKGAPLAQGYSPGQRWKSVGVFFDCDYVSCFNRLSSAKVLRPLHLPGTDLLLGVFSA